MRHYVTRGDLLHQSSRQYGSGNFGPYKDTPRALMARSQTGWPGLVQMLMLTWMSLPGRGPADSRS
jgi:hypothetical protein